MQDDREALIETCKELLVAVAAAMRVIADLDAAHALEFDADTRQQRFVDELHLAGIMDGFGVRAQAVIQKAEDGRSDD